MSQPIPSAVSSTRASYPEDFDAGMIQRWDAWKATGRDEALRARRQVLTVMGLALAAGFVAVARVLFGAA